MIDSFEKCFRDAYPREGCGILAVVKGKLKWFPCTNVAKGVDSFIIDSTEYLHISRTADIVGIVHSHPDAPELPSKSDIAHCNALGVKYYIFSYPSMDLHVQEPVRTKVALLGREYEFGVQDCFEAFRDYYITELDIDIPFREAFEDDWWLKGLDYFTEDYICSWGFEKVETLVKGDLLIFAVHSDIGNHCGVYLGDEIFYHHAVNRLSCREHLQPLWARSLIGVYRYVT